MKGILKLLVRLYPSRWQDRYGEEFEALLEDRTPRPRDAFDVLLGALKMQVTTWSFARITLASCVTGLIVGLAISLATPAHYVSQTFITVTPWFDAEGHHVGNVGQDAVDVELRSIKDDLFSSMSLAPIIREQNLYPRERARMPLDAVIYKMRRDINIRPLSPDPSSKALKGFALQFNYSDPHIAQKVDGELVSQFVTAALRASVDSRVAGHTRPKLTFRVEAEPSLPQERSFPNRRQFELTGLLAGLAGGLIVAVIVRSRQKTTDANS
jgi:hypothetical protein